MYLERYVKMSATFFFTLISSIFSVLIIPIILLIIGQITDYISGMIASYMRGEHISPRKAVAGTLKKLNMWIVIIAGFIMDCLLKYSTEYFGIHIEINYFLSSLITIWLICNELLSILQNISSMGTQFPKFIQPLIDSLMKSLEEK